MGDESRRRIGRGDWEMILDEMQLAFIGGLREYKKEKNGTVGCGSQEEMQVT